MIFGVEGQSRVVSHVEGLVVEALEEFAGDVRFEGVSGSVDGGGWRSVSGGCDGVDRRRDVPVGVAHEREEEGSE